MTPDPSLSPGAAATEAPLTLTVPVIGLVRAAVAAMAVFVGLAALVSSRWSPLVALDDALVGAAHRFIVSHHALLPVVTVVTDLGGPVAMDLVTVVAALALLGAGQRRAALYLVVARLLELAVETAIKDTLDRPRPRWTDPVASATSSSFPSGHSAGTTVVYLGLLTLGVLAVGRPRRRAARVAVVGAVALGACLHLAVPASRVVLGVHYPSDVVGGMLLGLACALLPSPLLLTEAGSTSPPGAGPAASSAPDDRAR